MVQFAELQARLEPFRPGGPAVRATRNGAVEEEQFLVNRFVTYYRNTYTGSMTNDSIDSSDSSDGSGGIGQMDDATIWMELTASEWAGIIAFEKETLARDEKYMTWDEYLDTVEVIQRREALLADLRQAIADWNAA